MIASIAAAEVPHSVSLPSSLGELASQRGRIRKRMRLGERTQNSAVDSTRVPSPLGEKDRMRGDFAKQLRGSNITPPDFGSKE